MGGSGLSSLLSDLNPIEHVRRYLTTILHEKFPKLASFSGGPAA